MEPSSSYKCFFQRAEIKFIEPLILTKTITEIEIYSADLHTAESFYNEELRWDAVKYIRSVSFDFKSSDNNAISTWLLKLITRIPEYMYFLSENNFKECLILFSQLELSPLSDKKGYFINSIKQIADHDEDLVPLTQHVCEEILMFQ